MPRCSSSARVRPDWPWPRACCGGESTPWSSIAAKASARSWRSRYDRLHLHTPRVQSVPARTCGFPVDFGRWVAKDDVAEYLRAYARHQRIAPRFATEVRRFDHDGRVVDRDLRRGDALGAADRDRDRLQQLARFGRTGRASRDSRARSCTRRSTGTPAPYAGRTCSSSARAIPAPRSRPISPRAERRPCDCRSARRRTSSRVSSDRCRPRCWRSRWSTPRRGSSTLSTGCCSAAVLGDLTPYGMPAATRRSRGAGACDGGHADDRCRSGRGPARGTRSAGRRARAGSTGADVGARGRHPDRAGCRHRRDRLHDGSRARRRPPRRAGRARASARHRPPDAADRAGSAVHRTLQPAERSAVPDQAAMRGRPRERSRRSFGAS